tara:strand:- start:783 stop:1043 length:261 start_codon:yes stop_codon:yes gene_type:complete
MVSSIREKIWEVEKEKKRQRRLAKEGVVDAVKERQEPENNQPEYKEVEVREIPTEASDSNSVINGGEIKAKINKPKKKAKKASKKA